METNILLGYNFTGNVILVCDDGKKCTCGFFWDTFERDEN